MMLEQMIEIKIDNTINKKYPHLRLPIAVYARITKVQEHIEYYEYNLKILDENKEIDSDFPEVPGIKSKDKYEYGDTVAVLLLYGQLNVFIVGRVI